MRKIKTFLALTHTSDGMKLEIHMPIYTLEKNPDITADGRDDEALEERIVPLGFSSSVCLVERDNNHSPA